MSPPAAIIPLAAPGDDDLKHYGDTVADARALLNCAHHVHLMLHGNEYGATEVIPILPHEARVILARLDGSDRMAAVLQDGVLRLGDRVAVVRTWTRAGHYLKAAPSVAAQKRRRAS